VLFVSHNMVAIESLCTKGILLENGLLSRDGPISEIVRSYSEEKDEHNEIFHIKLPQIRWGGIESVSEFHDLDINDNISMNFSVENKGDALENVQFDFAIFNEKKDKVIHSTGRQKIESFSIESGQRRRISLEIISPKLSPGKYFITVYIYETHGRVILWGENIFLCSITQDNMNNFVYEKFEPIICPNFELSVE